MADFGRYGRRDHEVSEVSEIHSHGIWSADRPRPRIAPAAEERAARLMRAALVAGCRRLLLAAQRADRKRAELVASAAAELDLAAVRAALASAPSGLGADQADQLLADVTTTNHDQQGHPL